MPLPKPLLRPSTARMIKKESLRQKVLEWQRAGTGKFLYRPKGREADNSTGKESPCTEKFLFVHQEVWQQRLLRRYGSELVLLDATYKTTKYALPLFFLCVHTNVGYKVVSEFICENEDADSIAEALSVIKGWNDWWMPSFFMVDYSTGEIDAIKKNLPTHLCKFVISTEIRDEIDGSIAAKVDLIHNNKKSSLHFCNAWVLRAKRVLIKMQW